jgi:hypothetical protein
MCPEWAKQTSLESPDRIQGISRTAWKFGGGAAEGIENCSQF